MKALLNLMITRKYYERDAAYLALIDSFIQVGQGVFFWFPKVSFGMMRFKHDTGSPQSLTETKVLEDCWMIHSIILILNTLKTLFLSRIDVGENILDCKKFIANLHKYFRPH